jgi:hypothetical protein
LQRVGVFTGIFGGGGVLPRQIETEPDSESKRRLKLIGEIVDAEGYFFSRYIDDVLSGDLWAICAEARVELESITRELIAAVGPIDATFCEHTTTIGA